MSRRSAITAPALWPADQLHVRRASQADRLPLYRMLELYQHDLSDIWDQDIDAQGEFGYALDKYWAEPGCQAFVFLVAGHYAGFALADQSTHLPGNEIWLAQFFVMKKYRRQGLGLWAAAQVFDALPGKWELGQMAGNLPAQTFWRNMLAAYTGNQYTEYELHEACWDGLLQCFDNRGDRASQAG